MLIANYIPCQNTGSRVKRVNSRVNTQLGDLTVQYRGSVQVSKSCCRRRVSKVIGRYIYRLNRSNGSTLGGSNAFLHLTHFSGQGRLVTYRRRHTSQQGRYFGTCLGKAENIINEKQHVTSTAFFVPVTEIFRYRQTGKGYTGTCSRRFVHLSEYQGGL